MYKIVQAENLEFLETIESNSVNLIYIDPPFNTGKVQSLVRTRMDAKSDGARTGFAGQTYGTQILGKKSFVDIFDDYLSFLEPRLVEAHRVLAPNGTLYLHIDYREVHYVKILLDHIFGRDCFLNEVIWAYDYGGRPRNRWPPKHDNILVYVKNRNDYVFNYDEIERIPYMAPGLVTPEKSVRGKLPTDTWWHTIVPTNSAERTGYPTQKPLGILKRIVQASSRPGDLVLDFFAGSGAAGMAAWQLERQFLLVDNNLEAIHVMKERFVSIPNLEVIETIVPPDLYLPT